MKHILIITTEDLKPSFNAYIRAKIADGYTVNIITVDEMDEKNRSRAIQNALNAEPCSEPFFVIFGGLANDVEPKSLIMTDMNGNTIDGEKYISDSAYNCKGKPCRYYIGRFPTNEPAKMELLCNIALKYRNRSSGNSIMLLSGISDIITFRNDVILKMLAMKTDVKHYSILNQTEHTAAFKEANTKAIICYSGHGALGGWSPNVDVTDFQKFTECCHVLGLCCDTNNYDYNLSFGARLLIEREAGSYLGASSKTYSIGDREFEIELWKRYIAREYATIGEWYLNTIFDMVPDDLSGACRHLYGYSLLGDPTLPLY